MPVTKRVIWLSDLQWAKVGERAEAFGLSRSAYLGKLIEWRQPDATFVTTGQRGMEPIVESEAERSAFAAFRPAPKPGRK